MITRNAVPTHRRTAVTAKLFGLNFPMKLEPLIFNLTDHISDNYAGGYWDFYILSNGGFYMSPRNDEPFNVSCENGHEGQLSGDALASWFVYMPTAICLSVVGTVSMRFAPNIIIYCASLLWIMKKRGVYFRPSIDKADTKERGHRRRLTILLLD